METIRWLLSYFVEYKVKDNYFDVLPKELLSYVIDFINSFEDLARICSVCRRFRFELIHEYHWKRLCIEWWKKIGQNENILINIINECRYLDESKGWIWLGRCLGKGWWRQRTDHNSIEIGEFIEDKLQGWGIQLHENGSQFVGYYAKGLQCGYGLFMTKEENGEHRYKGGFLDDEFDGFWCL